MRQTLIATMLGGAVAAATAAGVAATAAARRHTPTPVDAALSEWAIGLSTASVPAGPVAYTVKNGGSIPHAFDVEGQGIERQTPVIQPGASASGRRLGATAPAAPAAPTAAAEPIRVTGGGDVIQILPGPFPFPDSIKSIVPSFGAERATLDSQVQKGPYSNHVARISGSFVLSAWDKGAVRDSVDGVAEFTPQDGARWKVVLDRVQTKDMPHHPRFGGVIRGLYYHGSTGVHTPLVPTINSAVAIWSIAHLYRNGELVTDSAYVHVMLLSHTRRAKDFALACWDCSRNKIDELQLQITPAPGQQKFDTPGGFLFVNWERSSSSPMAS